MDNDDPPSQATNTTQTTSNIPDWAIPYATKNLGSAQALTDVPTNPYQTYAGNRVADFNPLQEQAYANVAGMTTNAGTGNAMNQTQDAYNQFANAGPYNAQNFGNQYGSGPQFQNMGLGYLNVDAQKFGQQDAQDYMSPYQQNVTNFQKDEAVRDYSRQLPGMGAKAAGAGAFGGTRHALVAAEGQRNLQDQLGGIQAKGSQNAYLNAQQQFNDDQTRRQQAQTSNQTAYGTMQGLGMTQNLAANLQAQTNAQLQAQYGLAGQQEGEKSRQFGANYGLDNRKQALAAAGQLGILGQQQYAQQTGINTAQQLAGAQIQTQEQQGLSNKYQEFLNQQNYPYKQLGFMSDLLRGTPTSGGATSMYQAPPSNTSQFAGLAGGLGSLFGAYNAANRGAAGGDVRGYAEGGIVGLAGGGEIAPVPNAAELMTAKNINAGKSTLDQELGMGADLRRLLMASMQLKELQKKEDILKLQAQIQAATGSPMQQDTTVAADVSNMLRQKVESSAAENAPERQGGIADLDTGNLGENYVGGGIVAFANNQNQPVGQDMPTTDDTESSADMFLGALGTAFSNLAGTPEQKEASSKTQEKRLGLQDAISRLTPGPFEQLTSQERAQRNQAVDYYTEELKNIGQPEVTPTPVPAAAPPAAAAPTAAPTAAPRAPAYGPAVAEKGEPEDSGYAKVMKTIAGDRAKAITMMESGQRTPETVLTAREYARKNREEEDAFLKAQGLLTPAESLKERLANLATAGREARNNRDVDRWMAAAQGFFAMAGGKSQYAMQNMAEGLNMGVKELRAVEQDYRKIDQLQKDKAELLKEATRQEARGDFAKGEVLRKEAEERNKGIADIKLKTGANLLETFDRAAATATTAEGNRQQRADAAAGRQSVATMYEQGRTDKAKEAADQKYGNMQALLQKQHPLMTKGTLPNKLTDLTDARLELTTAPKNPKFIKKVNDLTAEVDRMQDQVANDTAKDAARMIGAASKFKYVGVQ